MRSKTRKRIDSEIFSRTARKTKKVNVDPNINRGGIRL